MLRERLQKAILYGNEKELKNALENFKAHVIPDEGEIELAKRRQEYFDLQRGDQLNIHLIIFKWKNYFINGNFEFVKFQIWSVTLGNPKWSYFENAYF